MATVAKDKDYIIKDISLAQYGRDEIDIAETEMPGLMALREEYGDSEAAEGRTRHRFAAHDHPDRCSDRNAGRIGRRSPLGDLQHLLHPGPRGCGNCRSGHSGFRHQG